MIVYLAIILILIYLFNLYKYKKTKIMLETFLTTNNYNLDLYNIIKKHLKYEPLIEPSIKINNNKIYYDRYSVPIFDIKANIGVIKNIITDLNINTQPIFGFLKNNIKSKYDFIIGIDKNKHVYKFYIDKGKQIICLIYNYINHSIEFKYYNNIETFNITDFNMTDLNIFFNDMLINKQFILNLIENNVNTIYFVKPKEYHFILKNPINNIYVVSIKPNEYTLYFRFL
jgi:hypothetical protein